MFQLLIPLLSQFLAPSLGSALGLGTGLTTGLLSGLGTWAATGDAEEGLKAGLLGGLGSKLFGGANPGSGQAAGAAAHEAAHSIPGVTPMNPATGAMGWLRNNPAMAIGLGSALIPMLSQQQSPQQQGGSGSGFRYQTASPVPRNVVPYSADREAGASTYVAGDTTMDDSAYRYGQYGGEHMFFDPVPNSNRPILTDPEEEVEVEGIGSFRTNPGGLGGAFSGGRSPFRIRRRMNAGGPVSGPGSGQSDQVPILASDGEFVVPADVVSALGAGSNRAGAGELSDMLHRVRMQAYGNAQQPTAVDPRAMPA